MTERTRIRRLPEKAVEDRAVLHAILDAARVAHVGIVEDDGAPVVVPVGCARDGDRLLLHGSTGSRLFRRLASGVELCATVTLLDGMVLARSAFESSMHYRCAMVFGHAVEVDDKVAALRVMSEAWLPGRWETLRPPNPRELAATMVVALPLTEWSVKVSDAPPDDPAVLRRARTRPRPAWRPGAAHRPQPRLRVTICWVARVNTT
jgi:nitroimidazol reductase NimA-like FMN-containing flavoprotein (pyridoxamine 5'-phosphate oxidase superfamily)